MASRGPGLPEGTDTVIAGASATEQDALDIDAIGMDVGEEDIAAEDDLGDEDDLLDIDDDDEDVDLVETDDVTFQPSPALGATAGGTDGVGGSASLRGQAQALKGEASDKVQALRGQATDKARSFAEMGRDRAVEQLDEVVRMIEDLAAQVDDKVGGDLGGYARRASGLVSDLSGSIRDKDVDELFEDAKALVRRAPALAASAAAVAGFALIRVARAGLDAAGSTAGQPGTTSGAADAPTATPRAA